MISDRERDDQTYDLTMFWSRLSPLTQEYILDVVSWIRPVHGSHAERMNKRNATPLQMYARLIHAPYDFEPDPTKPRPSRPVESWMNLTYETSLLAQIDERMAQLATPPSEPGKP